MAGLISRCLLGLLWCGAPGNATGQAVPLPAPAGLVAWWRGDGNALDETGGHHGTPVNGEAYVPGKVGQAFSFGGGADYIEVPDSPELRLSTAVTIEFWAQRPTTDSYGIVIERGGDWTQGQTDYGVGLGWLFFTYAGGYRRADAVPHDTEWHHYAVVAVAGQQDPVFYLDGLVQPQTSGAGGPLVLNPVIGPLHIGAQVSTSSYFSNLLIDELSIYNRALAPTEIAAIAAAGSDGKSLEPVAPLLLSSPTAQTVTENATVTFSVSAVGRPEPEYQWRKDGVEIPGATQSSLVMINIPLAAAGDYDVVVSNAAGSSTTVPATLTVTPLSPAPAPSGLVAWWRGEGNALDSAGGNHGAPLNGVSYVPGKVGQAFSFGTGSDYIEVPDSEELQLSSAVTIEFWAQRPTPDSYGIVIERGGDWTQGQTDYTVGLGWFFFTYAGGYRRADAAARDTEWHHYAVTAVAGEQEPVFYLDGVVQPQTSGVGGPLVLNPGVGPLHIGAQVSGSSYFSNLLIDELSIYNRALTAAEITAIVAAGSAGKAGAQVVPVVTTQPQGQTVPAGSQVTLTVVATGTPAPTYQWRRNGFDIAGATQSSLTLAAVSVQDSGAYDVRVGNAAGSVFSEVATLTVQKTTPVIQWSSPAPIAYGTPLGAAQLNASVLPPGTLTYTPPAGTLLGVGAAQVLSVTFHPADTDSYFPATASVVIDVTRAPLTIRADDKSKVYGSALPVLTLTYEGLVDGHTPANLAARPKPATTALRGSDVGIYPITLTGGSDPRYDITLVPGTLSVTPAPLTIAAVNRSKVYGGAVPALAVAYTGFVNGDNRLDLDTPVTIGTEATAASSVGTFPIVASGATDANYSITFVPGALTVTPHPLVIRAVNKAKAYGAALPELTAAYSGFVNGDTAASLATPAVLETPASEASPVGTYPIQVSGATASNYSITFTEGILTVRPALLTVRGTSVSMVYGGTVPALGYTVSGYVLGEDETVLTSPVTVGTEATSLSPVGTYPVTVGGAAAQNYTVRFVPGSLRVTRAVLTVQANAAVKQVNTPNPEFTATLSGFVNGESEAVLETPVTFTTTATETSPVGRYAIRPGGATAANYSLRFVSGVLTVTP